MAETHDGPRVGDKDPGLQVIVLVRIDSLSPCSTHCWFIVFVSLFAPLTSQSRIDA